MLAKFFLDIITTSSFQLINTLIDTFFSKLNAFLTEQKREGRPMMDKKKLDGTMDESSAEQHIRKSDAIVHIHSAKNLEL